jgi:hypothetical protein
MALQTLENRLLVVRLQGLSEPRWPRPAPEGFRHRPTLLDLYATKPTSSPPKPGNPENDSFFDPLRQEMLQMLRTIAPEAPRNQVAAEIRRAEIDDPMDTEESEEAPEPRSEPVHIEPQRRRRRPRETQFALEAELVDKVLGLRDAPEDFDLVKHWIGYHAENIIPGYLTQLQEEVEGLHPRQGRRRLELELQMGKVLQLHRLFARAAEANSVDELLAFA